MSLRFSILPALAGLFMGASGCALETGANGEITVWGLARTTESRQMDGDSNRVLRQVHIQSIGLVPALTSARKGINLGYSEGTWVDVYAFDDRAKPEVRRWTADLPDTEDCDLRITWVFPWRPGRFPIPPRTTSAARYRGVEVLGLGLNALETGPDISALYSDLSWMIGEEADPSFGFAMDANRKLAFLISRENTQKE